MLEPILVEDCTYTKLVPSLERILNDLNENSTHHDYMVALVIVLLAEAGFYLSSTNNDHSRYVLSFDRDFLVINCICHSPKLRLLHVPKDWKSLETGVYEMYFQPETVPDIKCKLVAVPLGDTLILNFFPLIDGKTTYNINVQTLKYVNPYSSDLCGRYMKLKEISYRFKEELSTPVRSDVLHKAGVMGPSLQALPTELKLRILRLLDVYSLTRMAQCCSEFRELCSDAQLWRNIMHRDFPDSCTIGNNTDCCHRFIYNNRSYIIYVHNNKKNYVFRETDNT